MWKHRWPCTNFSKAALMSLTLEGWQTIANLLWSGSKRVGNQRVAAACASSGVTAAIAHTRSLSCVYRIKNRHYFKRIVSVIKTKKSSAELFFSEQVVILLVMHCRCYKVIINQSNCEQKKIWLIYSFCRLKGGARSVHDDIHNIRAVVVTVTWDSLVPSKGENCTRLFYALFLHGHFNVSVYFMYIWVLIGPTHTYQKFRIGSFSILMKSVVNMSSYIVIDCLVHRK